MEGLSVTLIPWVIGVLLFLASRKSLSRRSILSLNWIFSFLLLTLMTCLAGIAIGDFL